MRLIITLLFLSVFSGFVFCQPDLYLDSIYLKGVPIKKITSSVNNDYWILTNETTPRLLRINETGKLIDLSNEFSQLLLNGITTIASVDFNKLLIGTNTDFLYLYDNGLLIHIDTAFGLKLTDNHINSIVFSKFSQWNSYSNSNNRYLVTTNGSFYTSFDLKHFDEDRSYRNAFLYTKNSDYVISKKIGNEIIIASYTPCCTYYLADIDTSEFREILSAYVVDSRRYLGTKHGLLENNQSISLDSLIIYDLEYYGLLRATDKGIFYTDKKIDLGIGDIEAYEFASNNGEMMVASNKGLLRLVDRNCIFNISFNQDKQYLNFSKNEEVSFKPVLNNAIKTWLWQFGDGDSSVIYNPKHIYTKPGNYRITFTASYGTCSDTFTSQVVVYKDSSLLNFKFEEYTGAPFSRRADNGAINIVDYDNDGDPDIFIPAAGLYENTDSSELTLEARDFNPKIFSNGVWADMDNDGLNDFITSYTIYKNLGNAKFKNVYFPYEGAIGILDYNNDGLLDMVFEYTKISEAYFSLILLKNYGNMVFKTDSTFVAPTTDYVTQFKWFDINNDRKNDLIVLTNNLNEAMCCSGYKNMVFINKNGTYTLQEFGSISKLKGMNGLVVDANNDKKLDIFMQYNEYQNTFFMNATDSFRFDNSALLKCDKASSFADIDNNGWIDFIDNIQKTYFTSSKGFFSNYGEMIFVRTENFYIPDSMIGIPRAVTSADFDDDGYPEILFGGGDGGNVHIFNQNYLLKNKTPRDNNWIKVNCIGTKSNYNAIGATVHVNAKLNGKSYWQSRLIEAGNNMYSQNGFEQIFGVEKSEIIDTLEVFWPSGLTSRLTSLKSNKTYNIIEPAIRFKGDTTICEYEKLEFKMPNMKDIKYHWYRNDSLLNNDSNYFNVESSGTYKCHIETPDFSYYSSPIHITVNKAPVSKIWFHDDISAACANDSLMIESIVHPNYSYSWLYNGKKNEFKTAFMFITKPGKWNQIVTDNNHCVDTSNTLEAVFYELPHPALTEIVSFCMGDSELIEVPSGYKSYKWSTGDTTSFIYATESGEISVTIVDSLLCSATFKIRSIENELPQIDLGPDTILEYNDLLYQPLSSCNYYFRYFWNDSNQVCLRSFNPILLGFGRHEFTLLITDENNCSNKDTLIIDILPKDRAENKLQLFPNPASQYLNVYQSELIDENATYEIYNSFGTLVKKGTFNFTDYNPVLKINLSDLPMGSYYINVYSSQRNKKMQFLIII